MRESGCTQRVSVRKMRTESLPFSSVPSQSRLFLDYLADPLSLKRFYPSAVASHTDVANRAGEVLAGYETDRGRLCDALERMNSGFGAGPEILANIELLRKPDTVAVLTGQQTGLFTGPLYSIYKAVSAIRMSECLRGRGIDAVPVFWMATEDHDLEEVSNAFAIGNAGELAEARIESRPEDSEHPVGAVLLNDSVTRAAADVISAMPRTEFTDELRAQIERSWRPGLGIGHAFGRLMTTLLGKYGLIVVDPMDGEMKRLASPIYLKALERSSEIVSSLVARGGELADAGYHAQVLVEEDYFPFFRHDDSGHRVALRRADGGVREKGGKDKFTAGDLAGLARSNPERLSPGVMLRPVVQDHLFPTVCYFGGGAEIAYFAQNSEVYRVLERPVTPILHRQSFTFVEPKHARTMEKYGLTLADLFRGEEAVLSEVIDKFIDPATARLFADVEERINTELNRLDQALSQMDITLAASLATRRRKIIYHIGAMRRKYHFRKAETDEIINRRVKAAITSLLPNGGPQERTLNVISFLDRYGPNFIDMVFDAVDLDDKGHRVVYL